MLRTNGTKSEIDFVITWVDGTDKQWKKEKEKWEKKSFTDSDSENTWNNNVIRYRDWNLLPFLFRGIEKNAPWVRYVWVVTHGQVPNWLNTNHPKIRVVKHNEFIPEEFLPTFNSHTIELNLHRIEELSEKFVYFNDDMYILSKTYPRDFFYNEHPCDSAIINPVPMTRNVKHAEINNVGIINDHFDKKRVITKNINKWFNYKYGTKNFRNLVFLPWRHFVGFYEQHLPSSFLKSTFNKIWSLEEEELKKTCYCRFRRDDNVNQWLMKNWQICEGNFYPRKLNIGKMFMFGENDNYNQIYECIENKKYKLICINDTNDIDDFEKRKSQLISSFEKIYKDKSKFEL